MKYHNNGRCSIIVAALVLMIGAQNVNAENRLTCERAGTNQIVVRLVNSEPLAGIQFSICVRGVGLKSIVGIDRSTSSGMSLYQSLRDAQTLNVVFLSPILSSLPIGDGHIARILYDMIPGIGTDTCEVTLSGIVACDRDANALAVTASTLRWRTEDEGNDTPSAAFLKQNYPNPFNPTTTIVYRVDRVSHIVLAVYDIMGRQVELLVDQRQAAGTYQVRWNADAVMGRRLASGLYIARMQAEGRMSAVTMNYIK